MVGKLYGDKTVIFTTDFIAGALQQFNRYIFVDIQTFQQRGPLYIHYARTPSVRCF